MVGASRRHVLALGLGAVAAPALSGRAAAQAAPLAVFVFSDLHSGYERMAQTLAAVDRERARLGTTAALAVVNGDVFERGNAVALRSAGDLDFAFLAALAERMPTVVNLGNHETALLDDMALAVTALGQRGVSVVSNMRDRRTGRGFAAEKVRLTVAGRPVDAIGVATDEMMTYRQAPRAALDVPAPEAWAASTLPGLIEAGVATIVLNHSGVDGDRAILPRVPDGTLIVGGHEHLDFQHRAGASVLVHTGAWHRAFTLATMVPGRPVALERIAVATDGPADAAFARRIAETMDRHLTDAEREVLARIGHGLDLSDAARRLVTAMAREGGGDVGVISHTSLGTGFGAGPVRRFDMDAFLRFDGALFRAEVPAELYRRVLERANQDGAFPFDRRTGDFVYAGPSITPGASVRLVTNGWVRLNAQRYLGFADPGFVEIPDLRLRAVMTRAL